MTTRVTAGSSLFAQAIVDHWRITHVPESVRHLDLRNSSIEKIPDCVLGLPQLESLIVYKCRQLASLQGLPSSLKYIDASNCESLERVCFSFSYRIRHLMFRNCFNLDEEARRVILQQRGYNNVWLPGKEVPAEFTYKAKGNSIILPVVLDGEGNFSASSGFKACLVLPPTKNFALLVITCRRRTKAGVIIMERKWNSVTLFHCSDTSCCYSVSKRISTAEKDNTIGSL